MKREISTERPSYLKEAWPGKYKTFSWLEYAINIPYPVFLITTFKENGKSNACLHSWGCFGGDDKGVLLYSHDAEIIPHLREHTTFRRLVHQLSLSRSA